MKEDILKKIRGGLIVSCQALSEEPLCSSYIMARMAYAAMEGGAVGIRANTAEDIQAIREAVDLPLIGIIKRIYEGSEVYITPTMDEIDSLVSSGADIIATDGTARLRPGGKTLKDFFGPVREKYPDQLFMADCSTYEEGMYAEQLGFDIIGTTLSGYTAYTNEKILPDISMMERLVKDLRHPVIGEGGIWTPEQLRAAIDTGILAAVVGTAITRPREITRHFLCALDCV